MKITFIINSLLKGGAERVVSNVANYLCNSGNNVNIVTIFNTDVMYSIDENIKIISIDKKYINKNSIISQKHGLKKFFHYVYKYFANIKRKLNLKKIVNQLHSDVYISFLPDSNYLILKLRKNIKEKIIISVRNDPKIEYLDVRNRYLMKKLYKLADGYIFQTEEAQAYFKNIINNNSAIIPNSINEQFCIERYNGKRKKNIVTVGRLVNQKNHKLLIDAFYAIHNQIDPDFKLIIYGDGDLKASLKSYIKTLNMENKIILAGITENVIDNIYDSSLFVLSSDYEGMPNALMEAMALGLPVISTDCPCGGPKFLIKNNYNGILIDVGDVEKLSMHMVNLLNNSELSEKIGNNASKIQKDLNPTIINKKWFDFIKHIVDKS